MKTRRITLPLFWKFTTAIIAIVALFGSINALFIWRNVSNALESELEKRGAFIARSVAAQAAAPLMYEDVVSLQKLVDDILTTDPSVRYAFIVDGNRRVLAHTFDGNAPPALVHVNIVDTGKGLSTMLITPQDAPDVLIRDVAAPVLDGSVGTVRIGLEEGGIQADVRRIMTTLLVMVGVFLLAGIAGAFIFAHVITSPIKTISTVADTITLNALETNTLPRIAIREKLFQRWRMPFRFTDEIDLLAAHFNSMIERLETTYAELQQAQASLLQSEKLASVGTLAAGIAHEVNNPIAGLQNCIRRIMKNPENIGQNAKYLTLMSAAAERIEQVVKGLLNFTRRQTFKLQSVAMPDVVDNVLLLIGYRLESTRITIEKRYADNIPTIPGSVNHLEQVVLNLLVNSIDAIAERQQEDPSAPRKIIISIEPSDSTLRLSVRDTGLGILPQNIDKVFDPFFTSKEIGKGTGLGLAVSYHIVKEHGGDIHVESQRGEGTTFTVVLPLNFGAHSS